MSSLPPLTRRSVLTGGVGAATLALTNRGRSASTQTARPDPAPARETRPAAASTPPEVDVEDLGAPLSTVLIHEGAFGPGPDGQLLGYAVLQGDNAPLNVIDALTGEHLETLTLPGASGAWGITVTDDGDLYLGTYYTGHLYHYSPTTGTVTDLGQPVPGDEWLWGLTHDAQGRIYGGTYETAAVFCYDPATGEYTNLGEFAAPNSPYVRATAFDEETSTLFVGTGMADARLFTIDVTNGQSREIAMPGDWTGEAFVDLRVIDGRVIANVDSQLVVFDTVTGERLDLTDGVSGEPTGSTTLRSRATSSPVDGVAYYTDEAATLMQLDLATLTFSPAPVQAEAPPLPGSGIGFGVLPDGHTLVAWAGNSTSQGFHYDIDAAHLQAVDFAVEPVPSQMLELIAAEAEPTVYLSAGQQGAFAGYDPVTETATSGPHFGQVEGWIWHDDLLYSGTYPSGTIQVWDPADPETPPRVLATLEAEHRQNRPVTLSAEGGALFVGTTPGYGQFGGAITAIDLASGDYEVHRHVIPEHSIAALLAHEGAVYGGSAAEGGSGSDPVEGEAVLFRYDPATGQVVDQVVPVPGARSINHLIRTERGQFWGLADGVAFQFDPAGLVVLRSAELHDGATDSRDGELVETSRGLLFATTGHRLYSFDPRRLGDRHRPHLLGEDLFRTTLGSDGAIYGIGRSADGSGAWTRLLRLTFQT